MNVNLIVRTSGGNQSFWVQNVLGFSNISEHEIGGLFGLILNQTTPNSNMSSNTQGTGNLGGLGNRTAYGFGSLGLGSGIYSLPLNITISTSVQFPRGANDVEVSLSDKPLAPSQSGIYFKGFNETAYLPISNVTSASIVVTPYETVSYGSMRSLMGSYDAELVWASYCCGQTTKFLSMSSTLSLSYLESEGQLTVFPAFYTFGVDTAESAINLHVSPIDGGGSLTTGNTNNTFLGN
jgi:thermopsin